MNMEQVKRFVALAKRREELDIELKRVTAEMEILDGALRSQFIDDGIQRLNIDDRTVYLRRTLVMRPAEAYRGDDGKLRLVGVMKRAGLGELIREGYNTSTLDAWMRERIPEGKDWPVLPKTIRAAFTVQELFKVVPVKS